MAIADPFGMYQGTVGKELPALGPFKPFKPQIIGPGGKVSKILNAITSIEGLYGLLGGTAIGTGVALSGISENETEPVSNQLTEARSSGVTYGGGVRSYRPNYSRNRSRFTRFFCKQPSRRRKCC